MLYKYICKNVFVKSVLCKMTKKVCHFRWTGFLNLRIDFYAVKIHFFNKNYWCTYAFNTIVCFSVFGGQCCVKWGSKVCGFEFSRFFFIIILSELFSYMLCKINYKDFFEKSVLCDFGKKCAVLPDSHFPDLCSDFYALLLFVKK